MFKKKKKVQFFESYSKKRKGSNFWVILEKEVQFFESYEKNSILWVILEKIQLFESY